MAWNCLPDQTFLLIVIFFPKKFIGSVPDRKAKQVFQSSWKLKSQKLDFVQNWISRAKKRLTGTDGKTDLPVENVVLNHEEEIKYD